jgi:hypothetical protein
MEAAMLRMLAIAVGALCAAALAQARDVPVKRDSRIDVVYLTAKDCVYCRSWRYTMAGDWSRFSETQAGRNVQLVTVDKVTLRNPIKRDHYPAEYGHLYDLAPQFGNSVPAWWVVVDGQPVTRRMGENRWKPDLESLLEKLVAAKLAGGGTVAYNPPPVARPASIPKSVDDADHVPYLSARGKESYRRFLKAEVPRAFALSADGAHGWFSGSDAASAKALASCNASAIDHPCKLYSVDSAVVFKRD